jgi:hypothetical protein
MATRYDVPDMLRLGRKLRDTRTLASCVTCEHFKAEFCQLYKVRPPAEIIALGCESWEDNIVVRYITNQDKIVG